MYYKMVGPELVVIGYEKEVIVGCRCAPVLREQSDVFSTDVESGGGSTLNTAILTILVQLSYVPVREGGMKYMVR